MRRMREFSRQFALLALSTSIIALIAGVVIKKRSPHLLEMISQFGKPALEKNHVPDPIVKTAPVAAVKLPEPAPSETMTLKLSIPLTEKSPQPKASLMAVRPQGLMKPETHDAVVPLIPESLQKVLPTETVCARVEYPGNGFQKTKVSREEWKVVTDQFHEAKRLLQTWAVKNKGTFTEKTQALMETQLQDLKIAQPPSLEEPDLSWRGIGVWVLDDLGAPTLRLSGGFVKLAMQDSKRSLFEMTRLVAQSWAPCELKRVGADAPWNSLLKCLDSLQEQACGAGTYSEGGWAVSSSLAFELSPPGCVLPIFKNPEKKQCFQKMILPQQQEVKSGDTKEDHKG